MTDLTFQVLINRADRQRARRDGAHRCTLTGISTLISTLINMVVVDCSVPCVCSLDRTLLLTLNPICLLFVLQRSPRTSTMAPGLPALYTDQQPTQCESSNCPNKKAGRPAPPTNFMASARQGFVIRWLCVQCYEYYQNKSAVAGLGATGE